MSSPSTSPPPGLLDESDATQYIETSSGGDHGWLTYASKKLYTNAFIVSPGPPQKVAPVVITVATTTAYWARPVDSAWIQETWIWRAFVSRPYPNIMHWLFIKPNTTRYNGFGGKVEHGELPAQAAVRELKVRPVVDPLHLSHTKKEECGVEASLDHCGTLLFVSKGGPEWAFQIELYRADAFSGTLIEFVFCLFSFFSSSTTIYLTWIAQDRRDAT